LNLADFRVEIPRHWSDENHPYVPSVPEAALAEEVRVAEGLEDLEDLEEALDSCGRWFAAEDGFYHCLRLEDLEDPEDGFYRCLRLEDPEDLVFFRWFVLAELEVGFCHCPGYEGRLEAAPSCLVAEEYDRFRLEFVGGRHLEFWYLRLDCLKSLGPPEVEHMHMGWSPYPNPAVTEVASLLDCAVRFLEAASPQIHSPMDVLAGCVQWDSSWRCIRPEAVGVHLANQCHTAITFQSRNIRLGNRHKHCLVIDIHLATCSRNPSSWAFAIS